MTKDTSKGKKNVVDPENKGLKAIEYKKETELERAMKLSNSEILAKAIQDALKRDGELKS